MIDPEWFIAITGTVILLMVIGFAVLMWWMYCLCTKTNVPKNDPVPETQKELCVSSIEVIHDDYDGRMGFETYGVPRADLDYVNDRPRTRDYGTWI